jgi:hypothetical protein
MKENAATLGPVFQAVNHVIDLIYFTTIARGPLYPLRSIKRSKVTVFGSPLVPNGYPIFSQPLCIGVTAQEPDELVNNALKVNFLGGKKRKPLTQIKAQLTPKYRARSRSRAITSINAVIANILQEI